MDRLTRRQILGAGGAVALVSAVAGNGVANAQADRPIRSPWALTLDINLSSRGMDSVRDAMAGGMATGPYFVSGSIYTGGTLGGDGTVPADALSIGTYRAWGWSYDDKGGSVALQSFDMRGRGEIVGNGSMDDRFVIEGGTGDYRYANGQADMEKIGASAYRIWFDIATI